MHQQQALVWTVFRPNDWQKVATIAFWTVAGLFLVAALGLAAVNQSAGSEDSKNNLDTARNLTTGRGVTHFASVREDVLAGFGSKTSISSSISQPWRSNCSCT